MRLDLVGFDEPRRPAFHFCGFFAFDRSIGLYNAGCAIGRPSAGLVIGILISVLGIA